MASRFPHDARLARSLGAGARARLPDVVLRAFSWRPEAFGPADIDEYLRTYTQPGALRAGFAYYRNIPRDTADNRALLESGLRLKMPVLAIGGGRPEARGRGSEPEESLRVIADNVTGVVIADSGHFIPEEKPEELAAHLLGHFGRH